jgi:hypothetical protein
MLPSLVSKEIILLLAESRKLFACGKLAFMIALKRKLQEFSLHLSKAEKK